MPFTSTTKTEFSISPEPAQSQFHILADTKCLLRTCIIVERVTHWYQSINACKALNAITMKKYKCYKKSSMYILFWYSFSTLGQISQTSAQSPHFVFGNIGQECQNFQSYVLVPQYFVSALFGTFVFSFSLNIGFEC